MDQRGTLSAKEYADRELIILTLHSIAMCFETQICKLENLNRHVLEREPNPVLSADRNTCTFLYVTLVRKRLAKDYVFFFFGWFIMFVFM